MFLMNHEKTSPLPKKGDVVGCTDGDIGIVLSTYPSARRENETLVEVAWNSGRILIDAWDSQDFTTECAMFWIMSRV